MNTRKPKALAVAITCLILPATRAHTDIIYSGLVNTTFTDSITVDIDGDGSSDFGLEFVQVLWGNPSEVHLRLNYSTDHVRIIGSSFPDPDAEGVSNLTNATPIGATLDPPRYWDPGFANMMAWRDVYITPFQTIIGGPWADVANGYLGFQLISATSTNYGWLRMSVEGQVTSATLHDYAFENLNGQGIIAGAIPEPGTVSLVLGGICVLAILKTKGMHNRVAPTDP